MLLLFVSPVTGDPVGLEVVGALVLGDAEGDADGDAEGDAEGICHIPSRTVILQLKIIKLVQIEFT